MAKTKAMKCGTCGSRFHKTADHAATDALHAKLAQEGRDAVETVKARLMTPAALVVQLAAQVPDGWTATHGTGYHDGTDHDTHGVDGYWWAYFERTDAGVKSAVALNVSAIGPDAWARKSAFAGCRVEGHTLVDGRCFTRIGIDCSSCELVDDPAHRYAHNYGDLASLLDGERARCLAAAARAATAEGVPGLPFSRQPEWFADTTAKLLRGERVTLTPHGFGTGYVLRRGRPSRYGLRADPKLEARLGVSPIALETIDCD